MKLGAKPFTTREKPKMRSKPLLLGTRTAALAAMMAMIGPPDFRREAPPKAAMQNAAKRIVKRAHKGSKAAKKASRRKRP